MFKMGIKTSTKHISEKMDHRVDEYLFNIARICDDSLFGSVLHSSKSAFGILQLGSEEYYSFQRLERGLESVTREVLVNPILSDLFDETDQECLWPERRHHYVFFSNASIERIEIEPFEFIVPSKEERIGFRYSRWHSPPLLTYSYPRIRYSEPNGIHRYLYLQIFPWFLIL